LGQIALQVTENVSKTVNDPMSAFHKTSHGGLEPSSSVLEQINEPSAARLWLTISAEDMEVKGKMFFLHGWLEMVPVMVSMMMLMVVLVLVRARQDTLLIASPKEATAQF